MKPNPKVWYAMYADNYNTITVRHHGHDDKVVTLCGDDLLARQWV